MTLEITHTNTPGEHTLVLAGELDMATRDQFNDALAEHPAEEGRHVVVDLTDLVFLDSTGIGALVGAAVAAREAGGSVTIRGANGTPLRALQITGVIELLTGSVTHDHEPS